LQSTVNKHYQQVGVDAMNLTQNQRVGVAAMYLKQDMKLIFSPLSTSDINVGLAAVYLKQDKKLPSSVCGI
jgi:hypothetical protein